MTYDFLYFMKELCHIKGVLALGNWGSPVLNKAVTRIIVALQP